MRQGEEHLDFGNSSQEMLAISNQQKSLLLTIAFVLFIGSFIFNGVDIFLKWHSKELDLKKALLIILAISNILFTVSV